MDLSNFEFGPNVITLIDLLKVATLIHRPMRDGVADPLNLSPNELRVLMALGGEGAMAGHELAELIGMPPMNVSRALSSLHGMGLVEQIDDPTNRRRKPHVLNGAGIDCFRAMEPRIAAVADFLFGKLSVSERSQLRALLEKLDAQLIDWQPPEGIVHVPRP
jgi:DNA-binding MarR family transcriptional regulator